jgi:hypothetical protein
MEVREENRKLKYNLLHHDLRKMILKNNRLSLRKTKLKNNQWSPQKMRKKYYQWFLLKILQVKAHLNKKKLGKVQLKKRILN